ncbi:MAG: AmmeMemoRadiSam system protein B, partial [Vallitaleaceae bacterium]|nr:AmmeMemoRadiSam system protein B [Vallitaleaceae bacterium]
YFPGATIVPIMIGEEHNQALVDELEISLSQVFSEYNGRLMIIGTVDFAHYLDEETTVAHDLVTKELIVNKDYSHLLPLSDGYIDSPSVLVLTMRLLEAYDISLLGETNSKTILGYEGSEGMTSYQSYIFEKE